ncbi:hypothetical protein D3C81_1987620 [compost metagenome]
MAHVFDQMAVHRIRRSIQHGIWPDQLVIQPHHHYHRFNRRARFKAVAAADIMYVFHRRIGVVVGVERGIAGHAEDLTGIHLHQHRTAGIGLVGDHPIADLGKQHVLNKFVDA